MKKIILAGLMMAGLAVTAKAQKGSILLYGDANISTTKSAKDAAGNSDKTTSWGITPGIGYQFDDHWTAGVNLGYRYSNNAQSVRTHVYNVGPFVRYTQPISDIFSIYGQLNASYQHETQKPSDAKWNGFGANLFPAVQMNIKNGFALNFSFGGLAFNTLKAKGASSSSNSFDVDFGKTAAIGISKNFGGRRKS